LALQKISSPIFFAAKKIRVDGRPRAGGGAADAEQERSDPGMFSADYFNFSTTSKFL
jgi:hypothetical protein